MLITLKLLLLLASTTVSVKIPAIRNQHKFWSTSGLLTSNDSAIVARQVYECPAYAPVDCESYCCEPEQYCLDGECCPDTAETCGKGFCLAPGETCCGDGSCEPGYECMDAVTGGQGCCEPGQTACDLETCCPEGSTCISDTGYCDAGTIESTETFSSTSMSTSTEISFSEAVSTETISSSYTSYTTSYSTSYSLSISTSTSTSTSWSTISSTCTPTATSLAGRSDDSFEQYCNNLPVIYFPYYPGETEELISSTCGGMGGLDQVILTWAGDGKVGSNARRTSAGCDKGRYCKRLGQAYNSVYNGPNECDEFPPASTTEGGDPNTHKQCIYWRQNRLGGHIIWSYATSIYHFQPKQKFVLRVIPGCGSLSSRKPQDKRHMFSHFEGLQAFTDALKARTALYTRAADWSASNSSSDWLGDHRPGAPPGLGVTITELDGVPGGGSYTLDIGELKNATSISIADDSGIEYASGDGSSQSLSFTTDGTTDDTIDLSLCVEFPNKNSSQAVSYTASAVSASSQSAPSAPSASSTPGHASSATKLDIFNSGFAVLLIVVTFLKAAF